MNFRRFAMVNAAFEERCHSMLESCNMASQRFCLRWNNHQSNLLSVFDQLLQEQCFVDVTLAVEGRFLRAHKMVLSACSPYFQTLFTEHPDKHPIVILKDVPYADMRCLLDFMYRGEVSVNQDRLTAFLKVAETLRIKGLTEVNDERCDLPSITNSGGHLPPPQLHRMVPRQLGVPPLLNSASLLGSALTAPKRKRGRPRKLSGGSEVEVESDGERGDSLNLPELLEVRMDDGRDERCSNGDGDVDVDADTEGDEAPPGSSGPPPSGINSYPLEGLLKPKTERRSSDEISMSYDYPPNIKHETSMEVGRSSPYSSGGGSGGTPNSSFEITNIQGSSSPNKGVIRRRVRRRANSGSQDPAEHLTEMSVRDPSIKEETISSDSVDIPKSEDSSDHGVAGFHFLTEEGYNEKSTQDSINEIIDNLPKARSDLLEYLVQPDGSVVCKWCGEVLPSRTHWYRHKYKFHVPAAGLPSGLEKCVKCNTFFKSRKGYVGHCIARHGSVEEAEKEDDDHLEAEASEPGIKTEVDYDEDVENVAVNADKKISECSGRGSRKRFLKEEMKEDYIRQREREEKLVADIIAKVKKECEAQSITMCRRGYSRRSTVMTSFKEYDKRKGT